MNAIKRVGAASLVALAVLVAGCAHSPASNPHDPYEDINRDIYAFNLKLDRYLLRPTARAYKYITPDIVEVGVDNFLSNFFYPRTVINSYLQGKLALGTRDLLRFVVNSTVGILGIFDPATPLGMPERREDFGQTLGYWGLGHGAYLMLPVLGPSTSRDLSGRVVDILFTPTTYLDSSPSFIITAADIINTRARLLSLDRAIETAFDPYSFVRGGYLQNRRSLLYDGNPPIEEADYDLEDGDLDSIYEEAFDDAGDAAQDGPAEADSIEALQ